MAFKYFRIKSLALNLPCDLSPSEFDVMNFTSPTLCERKRLKSLFGVSSHTNAGKIFPFDLLPDNEVLEMEMVFITFHKMFQTYIYYVNDS